VLDFAKPKIAASKCLEFAACRYNGAMISSEFVRRLEPHVEFLPVCPEVEIGLPVPRDPIRIVKEGGVERLLQPETGRDFTKAMTTFASSFLDSLGPIDGFLLKSRSPSCGIKDVKRYPSMRKGAAVSKGAGMFGGAVLDRFRQCAIEDEGRVMNQRIREHFLIRIYTSASFRHMKSKSGIKHLVRFHSENKLLLMAHSQKALKVMGRIVANPGRLPVTEVLDLYEKHLCRAFAGMPRYTSSINVLMHAMGYFSRHLSGKEKRFLLDSFEEFRNKRVPLSVPANILKGHIIRFEEPYLMQQTFFRPFPEELLSAADSGKGRDLPAPT
jgi:uncharacterized protein YbgA (DUF1722 family)/uncharacterized protein YbbK (DUF523 family)